jgi:DNA processing protein
MPALSPNTQAILLLTAPLIAKRGATSSDLLSPGEYKRLARHLREIQRQPADLLSSEVAEILRRCQSVIEESRLERLLSRGFLLSQVIEHWQARAIWVVSRADPEYPRRLKAKLRENAPAVIYGCGDMSLLDAGGLAVVGSRHVDEVLIDYTKEIGRLAARSGRTLVSGGAKGIDQAAMNGALDAGGRVIDVLADSLEKTAMNREHRNLLLEGQLVLISPYDPNAGFNVGNAMQRNKLIYALADASLVVSSDLNKGGTWAGAIEQIENLKLVPVYIRSTGEPSSGLDGLRKKGAILWPNPKDAESFLSLFGENVSCPDVPKQSGLTLFPDEGAVHVAPATPVGFGVSDGIISSHCPEKDEPDGHVQEPTAAVTQEPKEANLPTELAPLPADALFAAVRDVMQQLLRVPMKETEVATELDVSTAQAKQWLSRLVAEGVIEKRKKPLGYIVKQTGLFE